MPEERKTPKESTKGNARRSKRAEANCKNAKRSTGPKTTEGKKKVSQNALKHGMLSPEVLIRTSDGRENPKELKQLRERLHRDRQPVGALEEMLVEMLVVNMWRRRRLLRFETGKIRVRLDHARDRELMRRRSRVADEIAFGYLFNKATVFRRSSVGVHHLLRLLDGVVMELEDGGPISSETQKAVSLCFKKSGSDLPDLCVRYEPSDGPCGHDAKEGVHSRDVLRAVNAERPELEELLQAWEEWEAMETEAKIKGLHLPDESTIERILKYEGMLDGQLFKLIAQLEAVQKRRLAG